MGHVKASSSRSRAMASRGLFAVLVWGLCVAALSATSDLERCRSFVNKYKSAPAKPSASETALHCSEPVVKLLMPGLGREVLETLTHGACRNYFRGCSFTVIELLLRASQISTASELDTQVTSVPPLLPVAVAKSITDVESDEACLRLSAAVRDRATRLRHAELDAPSPAHVWLLDHFRSPLELALWCAEQLSTFDAINCLALGCLVLFVAIAAEWLVSPATLRGVRSKASRLAPAQQLVAQVLVGRMEIAQIPLLFGRRLRLMGSLLLLVTVIASSVAIATELQNSIGGLVGWLFGQLTGSAMMTNVIVGALVVMNGGGTIWIVWSAWSNWCDSSPAATAADDAVTGGVLAGG